MPDDAPRPYRILTIEDNDADVLLLRFALEKTPLSFTLAVIDDGAAALAAVERAPAPGEAPPDLIVLDLNLPKIGGMRILEAIRKAPAFHSVPVLLVSSSGAAHEIARARELGVSRFITKPTDLEGYLDIGSVIREMLTSAVSSLPRAAR